jgi:hypothetical protein
MKSIEVKVIIHWLVSIRIRNTVSFNPLPQSSHYKWHQYLLLWSSGMRNELSRPSMNLVPASRNPSAAVPSPTSAVVCIHEPLSFIRILGINGKRHWFEMSGERKRLIIFILLCFIIYLFHFISSHVSINWSTSHRIWTNVYLFRPTTENNYPCWDAQRSGGNSDLAVAVHSSHPAHLQFISFIWLQSRLQRKLCTV